MATIRDVARLAGVGLGTASRAISGKGVVSADSLQKVEEAVKQLDFRPSKIARAMTSKTQGLIGVYFPSFEGTYFAPILQAIETELRTQGLHMVTATLSGAGAGTRRERSLQSIEFLIDRQCDGILLIDNYTEEADIRALKGRIKNLALVNRAVRGLSSDCFSVNHVEAGRLAARNLVAMGHQRVAVMHSPMHSRDVDARLKGFRAEMQDQGLPSPFDIPLNGLMTFARAWEASEAILRLGAQRDFSAVFCASDVLAMAAVGRLQASGVRVPQDISVMGYDDAEIAAYAYPAISTVRIPSKWIAVNACRHLMNRCYGSTLQVAHRFQPEMIWRHSVRNIQPAPTSASALSQSKPEAQSSQPTAYS
jgi:LacI family transcriptional regulator